MGVVSPCEDTVRLLLRVQKQPHSLMKLLDASRQVIQSLYAVVWPIHNLLLLGWGMFWNVSDGNRESELVVKGGDWFGTLFFVLHI